jgi:tRNA threonylcarbamoyladenosine biosynthesis protein TsaE
MGVRTLYHFDFYRVERAEDILRLGWDDLVEESGSILAVEWASRFPELLPEGALRVNLQILPGEARRVTRVT